MKQKKARLLSKGQQLTQMLMEAIEKDKFPVGELIPSEPELCRQYSVSRATVREAISAIVEKGYLNRIQGKGTYVTRPEAQPPSAASPACALILPTHGHFVEPQLRDLIRALCQKDL